MSTPPPSHTTPPHFAVIIVGLGPVGAFLAHLLSSSDSPSLPSSSILLLDSSPTLSPSLQPRAVHLDAYSVRPALPTPAHLSPSLSPLPSLHFPLSLPPPAPPLPHPPPPLPLPPLLLPHLPALHRGGPQRLSPHLPPPPALLSRHPPPRASLPRRCVDPRRPPLPRRRRRRLRRRALHGAVADGRRHEGSGGRGRREGEGLGGGGGGDGVGGQTALWVGGGGCIPGVRRRATSDDRQLGG